MTGRDGFGQSVLAEWTKLRTVPRWGLTLLAAVLITILLALLSASGSHTSSDADAPPPTDYIDAGHYTYRPLSGDGSITARVTSQDDTGKTAKAGLMIRKGGADPGTSYAAVLVTPGDGVRLQWDFHNDIAGSSSTAPRWLRLDRAGTTITGYESADGSKWDKIGTTKLDDLGQTVEIGMFVASPDMLKITRQFGGESIGGHPTVGKATFDQVSTTAQASGPWQDRDHPMLDRSGGSTQANGTFTLTGSGDVAAFKYGPDVARMSLSGVLAGLMAIVAVAVLSITSEYKRGLIRSTFAAGPKRGQVLAAKAVVLAAVTFAAGLIGTFGAFLLSQPILHKNGFDSVSLSDPGVLRAVVGAAGLMAVVAVLSLAVGTVLRRSAAAITVMVILLFVPQILASGLPLSAALWLGRLTPAAGFSIQETVAQYDSPIAPWAGFAVLCAYTAAALAAAYWLVRRRDA
jgi:ABC-type transport system involved in multi-copper enzyme maturation permease subunit